MDHFGAENHMVVGAAEEYEKQFSDHRVRRGRLTFFMDDDTPPLPAIDFADDALIERAESVRLNVE